MTVKDTLISMLVKHPSLFENKWQCYEHLFHTYGNGYEWKDGELIQSILAKKGYDDEGRRKKIIPTLYKLGIKKRDIPERVYKEMEDFTPIFHHWFPARLPETRAEFAAYFYDSIDKNDENKDIFLHGLTREEYIKREVNKTPKKKPFFDENSRFKEETEWMRTNQCLEFSKVYNYPSDIKPDWAEARQEWENYLRENNMWLKKD